MPEPNVSVGDDVLSRVVCVFVCACGLFVVHLVHAHEYNLPTDRPMTPPGGLKQTVQNSLLELTENYR